MTPAIKQAWMLWITPASGPGWGQSFIGSHKEAKRAAADLAGTGGKFTIKGACLEKPYVPDRRHSRQNNP